VRSYPTTFFKYNFLSFGRTKSIRIITGRNEDRLRNTFKALEGSGHKQIIADLNNKEDLVKLVENSETLNGLVHSAGITDPIPFQFVNFDMIETIFNVNFVSSTLLTQMLLKQKRLCNSSSIVFISSISGVACSSYAGSLYSATKGAINGLVKGMALDLSPKNIRVNTVCPGMIDTNIYSDGRISHDKLDEDKKRYPLKRFGRPEEVAYAVIYLLSDTSQWVTGSNLLIDGGFTLL